MTERQRPITGEVLSLGGKRLVENTLTTRDVDLAFRALSNEHVRAVNQHADHEALWARVGGREALRAVPSGRAASNRRKVAEIFRGPKRLALVAALTGLSAMSFALLQQRSTTPQAPSARLSFTVAGGGVSDPADVRAIPAEGGSQLVASETDSMQLELSDRSVIVLEPHTTLRLSTLRSNTARADRTLSEQDPEGASPTGEEPFVLREAPTSPPSGQAGTNALPDVQARIAQGTIVVRVPESESRRYRFHAGPYLVKMVGAAFSLEYRPQNDELRLDKVEGDVEVSTPRGTHLVRSGQSLHLAASSPVEPLKTADARRKSQSDENQSDENQSDEHQSDEQTTTKALTPPPRAMATSVEEDFAKLGAQGQFKTIVTIARKRGIQNVLGTHSARQLQELAQAARYTGQLSLAEKTWLTMRQRFSGQTSAVNAGFFLGRLAEQRGQHSTALSHFETYLRESPGGVYAAEAWGRKLQVIQSTSGPEAARDVARQYLKRYPSGAYAKTARTLLGNEE